MGGYLAAVWNRRYFWMTLVRMDLRSRYRGSAIGIGWSLLHPLLLAVILCFVLHRMMDEDQLGFFVFLLTGLCCWTNLATTVQLGCKSFKQAENYIRQHPNPMAIYPLRTTLAGGVHFLLGLGLALGFSCYKDGVPDPLVLASLVPGILAWFLLAWSLTTIAGIAYVFFRDTDHLIQIGFQFLFYATPIIYPWRVLNGRFLGMLMHVNPILPILRLVRDPIVERQIPDWSVYASAGGILLATNLLAVWLLARTERRLIFYL
jgi:lipopolysaccharide transport system permease protein